MKYYIPTSSLNAELILTREYIAPSKYYANSYYGNSVFEQIRELSYENNLFLFTEIPNFSIHDRERENVPMVIEVDIEPNDGMKKVGGIEGCDIYAYAGLIYLNLQNCRLLFNHKKDISYINIMCKGSEKNKWLDYDSTLSVCSFDGPQLIDLVKDISLPNGNSCDVNTNYIMGDRVRGFMYGYYIGAKLSMSPTIAKMTYCKNRIVEILATKDSNKGILSPKLIEELKARDKEYSEFDPNKEWIRKAWRESISTRLGEGITDTKVEAWLDSFDMKRKTMNGFCAYKHFVMKPNYNTESTASYLRGLSEHLAACKKQDKELNSIPIELNEVISVEKNVGYLKAEDADLYNEILRKIIWQSDSLSHEDISPRRNGTNYRNNLIEPLREICIDRGENWDSISMYFDKLEKSITSFAAFNISDVSDEVLQSLAAFIYKGDSYEALIKFLEKEAFGNYRYVMGLWGAMKGYVNISKQYILSNLDDAEVEKIYWDVQELLYGVKKSEEKLRAIKEATKLDLEKYVEPKVQTPIETPVKEPISIGSANEHMFGKGRKVSGKDDKVEPLGVETDVLKLPCIANEEDPQLKEILVSMGNYMALPRGKKDKQGNKDKHIKICAEIIKDEWGKCNHNLDELYKRILNVVKLTDDLKGSKGHFTDWIKEEKKKKNKNSVYQMYEGDLFSDKNYQDDNVVLSHENSNQINESRKKSEPKANLNYFIYDDNAASFILSHFITIPNEIKEIVSKAVPEFQAFIKEKKQKEKGYSFGKKSEKIDLFDNKGNLDYFKNWCYYDKGGKNPLLKRCDLNDFYFKQLIEELLKRYGN